MDKEVVFNALNSKFKDFEDALQNFSVLRNGEITIILTRNIKDYKKSNLAVFTPATYLNGNTSDQYALSLSISAPRRGGIFSWLFKWS